MNRTWICLCLSIALLFSAACSAAPEPQPNDSAPPAATSSDPLTGTWSGDWGPSANDRNAVTLELRWDGTALSGTVNPGPNAVALTKAAFSPDTGGVMMEADAQGRGGIVHYMIDGKVEGNTMSGSWSHDNSNGDFKITRN